MHIFDTIWRFESKNTFLLYGRVATTREHAIARCFYENSHPCSIINLGGDILKIWGRCQSCSSESLIDGSKSIVIGDVNNEGIVEVNCVNGHHSLSKLMNEKYEILFLSGTLAHHDGYCREAVTSFYVAVETFQEFITKVILAQNGFKLYEMKRIKDVMHLSERKLGAFTALYFNLVREKPPTINDLLTTRNKIVHGGEIPSSIDAFIYGKKAYSYINSIYDKVFALIDDNKIREMQLYFMQEHINEARKYQDNISVDSLPSLVNSLINHNSVLREDTFEEQYKNIISQYDFMMQFSKNIKS